METKPRVILSQESTSLGEAEGIWHADGIGKNSGERAMVVELLGVVKLAMRWLPAVSPPLLELILPRLSVLPHMF